MDFLLAIFSLLIGLVIGSFINCLVWRLHEKKTILGRSFCPCCNHKISWYDNIPVLSFLILNGKCRHCKKKISWQYPIVELITAILFFLAWYLQKDNFGAILEIKQVLILLRNWFLIVVMIIIFIYDLKWYLILDIITLPSMILAFILNLIIGYSFWDLMWAGGIGGGFFLFQFLISKGKWIGGGDIRMGLLMGFALGSVLNLAVALFLAYIIGSVVGIFLILINKKKWGSQIPLGVFLSISTIITLFWGSDLLNWYWSLLIN